ncbi:MAG: hypothetical protein F6K58_12750 [Symploca sp. SIO2E9]|nr:hypothetical protein [Symploca sp. SIO2E9]
MMLGKKTKYYVLLHDSNTKSITFPIKAPKNEFDHKEQFAGGYPAIFGGTDIGGLAKTLQKEVTEESRRTLKVYDKAEYFKQFYNGETAKDRLFFYETDNWQQTGTEWGRPKNRDEGEMMEIVTLQLDLFNPKDTKNKILEDIINLSGAPGGSTSQQKEFFESETAEAFFKFISGT